MKTRLLLAVLALVLAVPAASQAASSGKFKVSVNVTEDLAWSVPAQQIECGIYSGSGRTTFSFKSKKPRKVTVSRHIVGSPGYIVGGGPQTGTMSALAVGSPECASARDDIKPVSGCGTMSFRPEFNFWVSGRATFLRSLTGTSDYDDRNFDCAIWMQFSSFAEGAVESCGVKEDPIREIYSQALRDIGSEGITSIKFPFTPKTLLKIKKRKKKTFKKNLTIKCEPVTERGFRVVFDGSVKASVTFQRVS